MVINVLHVLPQRIILYGQSIGTTCTCAFASKPEEFPVGGVILHSPIASGLRLLLGNSGRIPFLDVFHNADLIVNCPWPVQFIHGGRDSDVPLWHCQLLHDLAMDPRRSGRAARERFVRDVVRKVERNCGSGGDLTRARTDRPLVGPHYVSHSEPSEIIERWWSRRVFLWIAEEAGHNDVEVKYKREYYNVVRTFISAFAAC
eukprot:Blabericola_migrator_1__151@NODE_103_length_14287_cov_84_885584_g91_i0_p5_GENE_NODE_103_length_14287_cov_84_885584_g91_i0NODE_103_length_14287_cov_84_885584_g91_i0_p5_ORF_typecomplete_len202_score11_15Peptidase_S9/PF00326_21/0_00013Peptidase_S9/PF00326_21/1_4e03Abhydrolase_2/PF02230_16/0_00018Hydrolase_4/PF12146_8/0_00061DLH/PF01738_18/0_0011DUF1749/PF08538_10/0_0021DUF1749/PF08538_10/7_2e03Abhydrolase_1/PF00561_20/0_02Ser_hydrolase/PF06821_13/0_012DUF818/PF05677_12/0_015Abhydrolase_3/PF07859_13